MKTVLLPRFRWLGAVKVESFEAGSVVPEFCRVQNGSRVQVAGGGVLFNPNMDNLNSQEIQKIMENMSCLSCVKLHAYSKFDWI